MGDLSYIHLNINLAYVAIFATLGLLTYFVHIPKDKSFSGYRKSRIMLSCAFLFMAVFCTIRFLMPKHQNGYINFWLLSTASLVFSWLNYTSFLYLIDAEYRLRKSFIIDGLMPITLMAFLGVLGVRFPQLEQLSEYVLGAIFTAKCIRMFYICEREWRRVNHEQQNFYGEEVDIAWMRILIWITLALSICTATALFVPAVHIIYDYIAPLAYIYMTLKVVNYLPRKIDEMRAVNTEPTEEVAPRIPTEKSSPLKNNGLEEKIGGYVNRWVEEKRYCSSDLSIKDVATQIGTNHNYLSQYLNDCLGITFQMCLNTLRIEESKNILTSENISIEEVGIRVGIPESYNFSRWFKVVTGTTPLRYRKEANQEKTN